MHRAAFIRKLGTGLGLLGLGSFPFSALGSAEVELDIFHTADLHIGLQHCNWSSVAALIDSCLSDRSLLFDTGDMFHGTGLMNNADICAMIAAMRYDAATIGEHDLDMGAEALAQRVVNANFPFIISNYDVSGTPLEYCIKPWHIIHKSGVKIGVFALGINTHGNVENDLCGGIKYLDPVAIANDISHRLKYIEKCDMVICLSHLGFQGAGHNAGDIDVVRNTGGISLLLGGHTHMHMEDAAVMQDSKGAEVMICHTGWSGEKLGHIYCCFNSKKDSKLFKFQTVGLHKQTIPA